MESKYGSRRKPSSGKGVWLAGIASFILGGLLVGYVVWYNATEQRAASVAEREPVQVAASPTASPSPLNSPSPTPLSESVEPENADEAVEAVSGLAEQQGGLDQRLAAAEQRLARLDLQSQAAAGNAARAEGLLIAFATRRAVERGAELGYLADQLRLRFGDERPNAVNTIINFSRIDPPIRLDTLLARLEGLGPDLAETTEGPSWAALQRELSQLFVIRRESTPSPQPERRLERARYALEQGRYQNAIDEIRNMPGAEKAAGWIADAERFRDAMAALENIETAAVLDQSGLRDGTGTRVNQPSPVGTSGEE
ncbi:hypothetical protein [Erythrobacter rubeus]|uniref:Inner membrane protein n=1 Tax=Erythrobacter rubeus TaxID=2760803 RepID=A0ABR8KSX2_9SPHN|nr:hypothetical protein [Erythrobacter rubeus]MBD2841231.1 hypothetical protein [Erythrobacter rubeus]